MEEKLYPALLWNPTPTPVPTVAILQGELINLVPCRSGPGDLAWLPVPAKGDRLCRDIHSGLPRSGACWNHSRTPAGIVPRDVKLNGDLASLEVVYPDKADLPFLLRSPWPLPQNVEAVRFGDEVTVGWSFFEVPLDERESPNSPYYVLEVWLCRDKQLIFSPLPIYENTKVSVIDQAGCTEPAHGRIVLAEKDGYVGLVEIKWPPYSLTPAP